MPSTVRNEILMLFFPDALSPTDHSGSSLSILARLNMFWNMESMFWNMKSMFWNMQTRKSNVPEHASMFWNMQTNVPEHSSMFKFLQISSNVSRYQRFSMILGGPDGARGGRMGIL